MMILSIFRSIKCQKILKVPTQCDIQAMNYAVAPKLGALGGKKGKKMSQVAEKKKLPVETDVKKLLSHVCGSNIYLEGQDVEIKPDSEYPDWLWKLRLGSPPPLEELDPNSKEYWRRLRTIALRRQAKLRAHRRF